MGFLHILDSETFSQFGFHGSHSFTDVYFKALLPVNDLTL